MLVQSGGLGKFNTGCKVAFAGWIMLCIANLLLLWVLTLPLGEGGAHLDWTPGTTATNGTPAKGPKARLLCPPRICASLV